MSCCLSELLCCACCQATSGACSCCAKVASKEQIAKPVYAAIFSVTSVIAWVFSVWAMQLLGWIPTIEDAGDCCSGPVAVYRLTWALFMFHLFLALGTVGVNDKSDCRAQIHFDWYSVKFLLLICLIAVAFVIPNPFFIAYGWIALVGAGIFVLLQLLMLVDFAHSLNEGWVEKYEETGERKYVAFLFVSTFLCFGTAAVLSILMYIYQMGPDKWVSPFLVSLNILFCLVITLISIHPTIQNADRSTPVGLFQAGFVSFYATYLVFAGLMDGTDSDALETTTIVLGSIFVIICVAYTAFRISGHEETYFGADDSNDVNVNLMMDEGEAETKSINTTDKESDSEKGPVGYSYSFFHLVFALGATYVCMLLTSWSELSSSDDDSGIKVDSGAASMWVKVVTSWLALLLYTWTVVAPALFPNREW
mmetsp:Transcript_291/g.524  ORF Transcript_291/g.524 Transcript_291/m.524 type:complete len:422 (-) Transcript_291:90-1355(-)